MFSFLSMVSGNSKAQQPAKTKRGFSPRIEALEDRVLMAANVLAIAAKPEYAVANVQLVPQATVAVSNAKQGTIQVLAPTTSPAVVKTIPAAAAVTAQYAVLEIGARIDVAKLKNLKENLTGIIDKGKFVSAGSSMNMINGMITAGSGQRFLDQAFGPGWSSQVNHTGSVLNQFQSTTTGRSRNPLDNQGSNITGGRNSQLSDGAANAVTDWMRAAGNDIMAAGASLGGAYAATGLIIGAFTGVDEVGLAIVAVGVGVGADIYLAAEIVDLIPITVVDPAAGTKEPVVQDVPRSSRTIITPVQIAGILAFLNGAKDPTGDDIGHGGPMNPQATPAAKTGTVGQWTSDMGGRLTTNVQSAAAAITARLQANITVIH